jgi:hypothetical protein
VGQTSVELFYQGEARLPVRLLLSGAELIYGQVAAQDHRVGRYLEALPQVETCREPVAGLRKALGLASVPFQVRALRALFL